MAGWGLLWVTGCPAGVSSLTGLPWHDALVALEPTTAMTHGVATTSRTRVPKSMRDGCVWPGELVSEGLCHWRGTEHLAAQVGPPRTLPRGDPPMPQGFHPAQPGGWATACTAAPWSGSSRDCAASRGGEPFGKKGAFHTIAMSPPAAQHRQACHHGCRSTSWERRCTGARWGPRALWRWACVFRCCL